jgi:hypothetical protein
MFTSRYVGAPRSTINIFWVLAAVVVWGLSYYLLSHFSHDDFPVLHFSAEILKDLGVVIAGLALFDWLWHLFSGDPVEQSIAQLEKASEQSSNRLEKAMIDAIGIVGHARHAGVLRINSDPRAVDAGFPTDFFENAKSIDLCGFTLHSLFAKDLIPKMDQAARRGCNIRVCIASPENSAALNNCIESARVAMPGQSESVIQAVCDLQKSLRQQADEGANRISLYVLQDTVMTASICRIDGKMLVVSYLQSAFTMNSPAMLLEDRGEQPLFATYKSEFEYLLSKSQLVSDVSPRCS